MTNMKKILFGLGTVTTVVAPVAAVVACGSDDKDTSTEWTSSANQWGVKSATELKNLLVNELKAVASLSDADAKKIFTTIKGTEGKELLLNVFNKTARNYAIVVEGTSLVNDKGFKIAVPAADLEKEYGIKNDELVKGSYVILINAGKITAQDVVVGQDENALGLLA